MNKEEKYVVIYYPDTGGHNFTPPYELLIQKKAIAHLGYIVLLIDGRHDNLMDTIKEKFNNILLFVVSTLIKYTSITIAQQYEDGLKVSQLIREKHKIPVLWTGLAPNILTKQLIGYQSIDFLLKGNGVHGLSELILSLVNNFGLEGIPNLVYKKFDSIIINEEIKPENCFTQYGDFNISDINLKNYVHNNKLDYLSSIGCVNACSFCSVPFIYNRKWFHNSVENIVSHFRFINKELQNVNNIHFRDDNFFVNKKYVLSLFIELSNNNLVFNWSAQTSINILKTYTDEELLLLKQYGCNNISIGIESGDSFILEKVTHDKTTKDLSVSTINRLLKIGISVSVTSIISFPFNKGRDFGRTLRFLMKLKLIYPDLSLYCTVFQPIPNTELCNEIFGEADVFNSILGNNNWTSKKRLSKLKKFEEFYFIFNQNDFYKKMPYELGKDLAFVNRVFAPFIRLRFRMRFTFFLWEYFLIRNYLKRIKLKHSIQLNDNFSELGIRHLNTNYNFGYNSKN
jgi:anaerobic magnesium-protoporphyrin IX monomethyl ester cyclase